MPLDALPAHPASRSYVLKLHRDAQPQGGPLAGRLENLATGRVFAFASADELLRCLAQDAPAPAAERRGPSA